MKKDMADITLKKAENIQNLLISKGFTWQTHEKAKEKILEELDELFEEINSENPNNNRLEDEFGDCLFSLINLGCRLNLDSTKCLELAILKFETRISLMQKKAKEHGQDFEKTDISQMLQWWQEIK